MNLTFFGGPFHRRVIRIPDTLVRQHRLELRVTSFGKNDLPFPPEEQSVAIYTQREDRSPLFRYFLGMADES